MSRNRKRIRPAAQRPPRKPPQKPMLLCLCSTCAQQFYDLLGGLIADKEEQIRQERAQAEALRAELDNRHSAMKSMGDQFTQFEGWAQEFAYCSHEKKQMIIQYLVNRIVVDRDYIITIHLNTVYEQFMEAAA